MKSPKPHNYDTDDHSYIKFIKTPADSHDLNKIKVHYNKDKEEISIEFDKPFHISVSQDQHEIKILTKAEPQGTTIDELSKICWNKIEELRLHEIIPLICEIKFIKLFENTLKEIRVLGKKLILYSFLLQFYVAIGVKIKLKLLKNGLLFI